MSANPNRGRLPLSAQEHQREESPLQSRVLMVLDTELKEMGETYCLIAKQEGMEDITVDAEWNWNLKRLRRELQVQEDDYKLWYRAGNRETVVDDDAGFAKFLKWAAVGNSGGYYYSGS